MASQFPTRNELKCSGCSFIIAHLLLSTVMMLFAIDYDVYNVTTEEQVTTLHNLLSSTAHRAEMEIACGLTWLSYPFFLMGLFGIKALIGAIHRESGGRMLVYVIEKSYLMWITVVTLIIPAISLTSVSFEWSFHEYTPDVDWIPSGYYVQLYSLMLTMEIMDCVAIADATFLVTAFILPRFIIRDPKFKKIKAVFDDDCPTCLKDMRCFMRCFNIVTISFALTCFVIFVIVLFEFAKSGFFSPTGHAKFLVAWSVVVKLLIGLRIVHIGYSPQYDKAKQIFDTERFLSDAGSEVDTQRYKMEEIHPQTAAQ